MSGREDKPLVPITNAAAEITPRSSDLVTRGLEDATLLLQTSDVAPDSEQQLLARAEAGDAEAQAQIADAHRHGRYGWASNLVEAAFWYRKAAEQGLARAQHALGVAYSQGLGVARDMRQAIEWYRRAAVQREKESIIALGAIFENGSVARELATQRPQYWEYLLTENLLRCKIAQLQNRYAALDHELLSRSVVRFETLEYLQHVQDQLQTFLSLIEELKTCVQQDIASSWGKPGVPGDPVEILETVNRLGGICDGFVEWEIKFLLAHPPTALSQLRQLTRGSAAGILDEIGRIPDEIALGIQEAREGVTKHNINLAFAAPPQMDRLTAAVAEATGTILESIRSGRTGKSRR
jgi:Sel1 repeat